MTLFDIIRERIRQSGPMDIAAYMDLCLTHPEYGYYMRKDPLGPDGDFTTAPEISQMFGELIGAWCADIWIKLGRPSSFVLAECGPGRGTLMADALRVTAKVQGFHEAAQLVLMETSPFLKEKQRQVLSSFAPTWCKSLSAVQGNDPLVLIANEFLDALPVRQAVFSSGVWRERVIDTDPAGMLSFKAGEEIDARGFPSGREGDIFEYAPAREGLMRDLGKILTAQKGAALFLDYGHMATAAGDTLQAVKNHKFTSVLDEPGVADLTSHVDFEAAGKSAQSAGAVIYGPVTQRDFLLRLGIRERAAALGNTETVVAALERLTGKDQMGLLFKVMALCHDKRVVPEGF